jgi:hypothetical protein
LQKTWTPFFNGVTTFYEAAKFDGTVKSPPTVIPDLIPDVIGRNLYPEVVETTRFRPQFIPGLFGVGVGINRPAPPMVSDSYGWI